MVASNPMDTVAGIMTKNVISIDSEVPVKKGLQIMIDKDIGSLVVLKKGEPAGIITERDVTRRSLDPAKGRDLYERPIGGLMSHPLITVPSTTPIDETFEIMVTNKIRRLPVVEQERLVGIITERDLFRWVLRVFYEPNIPDRIKKFVQ
jgi:CBS domain-containing protein